MNELEILEWLKENVKTKKPIEKWGLTEVPQATLLIAVKGLATQGEILEELRNLNRRSKFIFTPTTAANPSNTWTYTTAQGQY